MVTRGSRTGGSPRGARPLTPGPSHPAQAPSGTVRIRTEDGSVVLRYDRGAQGEPPRLSLEDPGSTFDLALHAERCTGPVPGVRVEVTRSGLFGDRFPAGAALLPDAGGEPLWLSSPERSAAGQILLGVVEALRAEMLPAQLSAPPVPAPRARVERIAGWDEVKAPNGLAGGLAAGERPSQVQQALGGAWSLVLDAAPDLPLEAWLWLAHREQDADGEVVRLTATWHGPGADVPWHVELHVSHRVEEAQTEFLVIDGGTAQDWTLADAVHVPGVPLTWRVHPAPRPDTAGRTGEGLYALITAFAHACPA